MKKHFVTFTSPGTFVPEETVKDIDSWDVYKAIEMSKEITERYGSKPFAFRFSTRERGPDDLDSKVTQTSGRYYLGGTILTIEDIKARNDPKDQILISNMECNGYSRVIESCTPWRSTQPLEKNDIVLELGVTK